MSEDKTPRHRIAVLEDEPPPEPPPPEPPPSLVETLRRFLVPLLLASSLFVVVVAIGVCIGWLTVWRPEPPEPPGGTIAVLPFVVQGEDETLGGPFMDELYTALEAQPALEVTPRSQVAGMADDRRGLLEIAEDLGVRYVVQGEIRPRPTGVQVTYSLVDAQAGGAIYSEARLTAPADQLLTLDDQVARSVLVGTRILAEEPPAE